MSKIKAACKILRRTEIGSQELTEACQVVGIWLAEDLTTKDIVAIVRPFFNAWLSKGQLAGLDFILLSFFNFLQREDIFVDEECRRLFQAILGKIAALREGALRERWEKFLIEVGRKISSKIACEWVRDRARKGTLAEKNTMGEISENICFPFMQPFRHHPPIMYNHHREREDHR